MTALTTLFLFALAFYVAGHLWLSARQIAWVRRHRDAVPAEFTGSVRAEDHAKAADYVAARQRLGRVEILYDALVLLALTLGGGIAALGALAARLFDPAASPVLSGTLQVLLTLGLLSLLSLPFHAWSTFVLEQRFGFNRTTPGTFVADLLKGWALGATLGGALVAVVLAVMRSAGDWWWLAAWAVWLAFSLGITWAYPRWIAPLFNRFTPLADAALRQRVDALLARCDFHARDVFVVDGSRRSSHGNAYFTGLGREKRVVFFDTLVERLTGPQVESVLAHELAHFKLRHIPQRLVVGALLGLAGAALLGWLAHQPWFYRSLGVPEPSDAAALLLFALVGPVFVWLASPLFAAWSRRHEYEADAFAARHASAGDLAEALVRLYRDNASTLTPDPVYSAFHDSHPSPVERIRRLGRLAAAATPRAP